MFNPYLQSSMRSTFIRLTTGLVCLSILVSSCDVKTKSDFEITMDPTIRGKINVTNHSSNAKTYQWTVAFSETENGSYSTSTEYGNHGVFEGDVSQFYIKKNSWVEITLDATGFSQSTQSKKIHVNNVPTRVVIGNLVVTRVNQTDELGYEWDDTDGSTGSPSYETASEFPDLLVNNFQGSNAYSASETTWDVNIQNGLPVSLVQQTEVFDDLRVGVSNDFYIELVDFDGQQGSMFSEPGKRIGVMILDLNRLTHLQNGGRDDNYPDIYKVVEDEFEADLYLHWD